MYLHMHVTLLKRKIHCKCFMAALTSYKTGNWPGYILAFSHWSFCTKAIHCKDDKLNSLEITIKLSMCKPLKIKGSFGHTDVLKSQTIQKPS